MAMITTPVNTSFCYNFYIFVCAGKYQVNRFACIQLKEEIWYAFDGR